MTRIAWGSCTLLSKALALSRRRSGFSARIIEQNRADTFDGYKPSGKHNNERNKAIGGHKSGE